MLWILKYICSPCTWYQYIFNCLSIHPYTLEVVELQALARNKSGPIEGATVILLEFFGKLNDFGSQDHQGHRSVDNANAFRCGIRCGKVPCSTCTTHLALRQDFTRWFKLSSSTPPLSLAQRPQSPTIFIRPRYRHHVVYWTVAYVPIDSEVELTQYRRPKWKDL